MLDLLVDDDPSLTLERRLVLMRHLRTCRSCAREYQQCAWLVRLMRQYWPYEAENEAFSRGLNDPAQCDRRMDEGWHELQRRIPELGEAAQRPTTVFVFRRAVAVAACVAWIVSVVLLFTTSRKEASTSHLQSVSARASSTRIEQLSPEGPGLPIAVGAAVNTSAAELKPLLINGKHRVVMNGDSTLRVQFPVRHGVRECCVVLSRGEVFVEVEPGGTPFMVRTAHADAIVTGTAFSVGVTAGETRLVVVEGSVEFSCTEGKVQVPAGHRSAIAAQRPPAEPEPCDAATLLAWATGGVAQGPAAPADVHYAEELLTGLPLPHAFDSGPIDLHAIVYDVWIEQERDWFERQFPWAFQLQRALAAEGVEVAYPELLVRSGVIWQLPCRERLLSGVAAADPQALGEVAAYYGLAARWLSVAVPTTREVSSGGCRACSGPDVIRHAMTQLDTLRQKDNDPEHGNSLLRHLAAVCDYLEQTRVLLWLFLRERPDTVALPEAHDRLAELAREIEVVRDCRAQVWQLALTDRTQRCPGRHGHAVESIRVCVDEIYRLEKGMRTDGSYR